MKTLTELLCSLRTTETVTIRNLQDRLHIHVSAYPVGYYKQMVYSDFCISKREEFDDGTLLTAVKAALRKVRAA